MRSFFIKAVLVLGVAILLVEGYYVYQSFDNRTATTTTASRTVQGTTSGTTPEQTSAPGSSKTVKPGNSSVPFVHRATAGNISANSTYLDNPSINNNPSAILSVTQNWNPGSGVGTYNNHPIGVWYDPNAKKWAIFNQDRSSMPEGAAFNVEILSGSTR